jgi:hypothetical protein
MNTFKHFVKVSRQTPTTDQPIELRTRVYDSVFGVEPGRTIQIELSIGELIQFENIIEPLPEYNWIICHENAKSLNLGEYLFPESLESLGRQG